MAQQGVGRFVGSCRLMSVLGIAEKSGTADCRADAESLGAGVQKECLLWGNSHTYQLIEDDSEKLEQFVRDSLRCQDSWERALASENFDYVVATIADIVEKTRVAQFCMNPPPKKTRQLYGWFCQTEVILGMLDAWRASEFEMGERGEADRVGYNA